MCFISTSLILIGEVDSSCGVRSPEIQWGERERGARGDACLKPRRFLPQLLTKASSPHLPNAFISFSRISLIPQRRLPVACWYLLNFSSLYISTSHDRVVSSSAQLDLHSNYTVLQPLLTPAFCDLFNPFIFSLLTFRYSLRTLMHGYILSIHQIKVQMLSKTTSMRWVLHSNGLLFDFISSFSHGYFDLCSHISICCLVGGFDQWVYIFFYFFFLIGSRLQVLKLAFNQYIQMVELQSCASLVNASALCAIEEEVKGEGVNVISEITAELERERRKNAELLERISILEAQIQERNKESLPTNGQV